MTVTIANILIAQASHNKGRQPALRWYLAAILVLTALAAFTTPAMADNITARPDNPSQGSLVAGIKAARAGHFADAIAILGRLAEQGHVIANHGLGLIYSKDRGATLPARPELAHQHFQAAAKKGHVGAIFELGFQFERGIGTNADMKTALQFYRVAAHHNHLNAQFNLAVLLSRGGGVKANPREAYFWALAAQHTARTKPQGALTFEKVTKLVRQIRSTLPHQSASRASRATTILTGQPI